MRLEEIYNVLDKLSPFEMQASWDNSGLILGSYDQEVTNVVLSIDIDEELLESVEEGSLIITHHPLNSMKTPHLSGLNNLPYNSFSKKNL